MVKTPVCCDEIQRVRVSDLLTAPNFDLALVLHLSCLRCGEDGRHLALLRVIDGESRIERHPSRSLPT
jgi:hypothetical protein